MNDKKKNLMLKGAVLLTIIMLFVTVSPNLVAGQGNTTSNTSQIDMSDESLNIIPKQINTFDLQYAAKHVSNRYLILFGFESSKIIQYDTTSKSGIESGSGTYSVIDNGKRSTVRITNTLEAQIGKTKNYRYEAQFTSDNAKAYSVEESYVETKKGNQITSTFYQKIAGSMNYCVSATEEKTIDDVVTKETVIDVRFSNATGSYYAVADMMGTWNSDESVSLNATITLDQNIFSQSEISNGRYTYVFAPEFDKFGQKYNVTLPDGTSVDPWFEHPVSTGGGWGTHLDVYWFAWTEEEGRLETLGGIILNLFLRYVKAAWQVSYFVFAIASIIALGTFYKSDMSGITILYYTVVTLWEILPIDMEFGYYTDRFNGDPLGDWYYMPLFNSLYFAPFGSHIDPWPCFGDPFVTVLGYDESASASVDGISLCINGTWVGYTGSTLLLPPATYIIQVESEGFHYFDVDGTPFYDNPATITVSEEDMTITVHYYYLPYYGVSSIDSYDGDVYNPDNLVGSHPDGLFATVCGYGPYQYYGWISGVMAEPAIGHIYVYGSGNGPLYVYVSSNGYNWNYVSSPYVTSSGWIDCGSYLSPFNYILLTAEDPNYVYSIDLDAVCVYPPGTAFTLTISSGSGGSTTPSPGAHQYAVGTPVAVTANPNSGYVLDYWLLDGQNVGLQNPITVTMYGTHTLQANFRTPPYHWLTVNAYDAYLGEGYPLDPNVWIDGNYIGTAPVSVYLTADWHTVTVDGGPIYDPYWPAEVYLVGYTGDYNDYNENNVYVNLNHDSTVNALYFWAG